MDKKIFYVFYFFLVVLLVACTSDTASDSPETPLGETSASKNKKMSKDFGNYFEGKWKMAENPAVNMEISGDSVFFMGQKNRFKYMIYYDTMVINNPFRPQFKILYVDEEQLLLYDTKTLKDTVKWIK